MVLVYPVGIPAGYVLVLKLYSNTLSRVELIQSILANGSKMDDAQACAKKGCDCGF